MSDKGPIGGIRFESMRRLLCALQDHIRDSLIASRVRHAKRFAQVAGVTAADTIYAIDRIGEDAVCAWFDEHWPRSCPVELVMEGLEGEPATFPRGTPLARTKVKCIVDPIDGTRCLMYDKRPAWSLAAVAPQRGPRTSLRDVGVAAMTELPTTKQSVVEQWSAVHGAGPAGVRGTATDLHTGRRRKLRPSPSSARDFRHGFASFVKFFPDGKALTAKWEEAFWAAVCPQQTGTPVVFDDQYLTTGGQIREVLVGHDRLIVDLRPLVFRHLGLDSSLVCHPYDICTALILQESGGIVEQPDGRLLDAPLDTTSPVAWVGYANATLARKARPVLRGLPWRRRPRRVALL